jgi:hypothetical protein
MPRKTNLEILAGMPRGMTTVRTADPTTATTRASPSRKVRTRTTVTREAYPCGRACRIDRIEGMCTKAPAARAKKSFPRGGAHHVH